VSTLDLFARPHEWSAGRCHFCDALRTNHYVPFHCEGFRRPYPDVALRMRLGGNFVDGEWRPGLTLPDNPFKQKSRRKRRQPKGENHGEETTRD
jgi:hypothetical protein